MPAFLETVAQELYAQYGEQMSTMTIVFPNWRSGLTFQRYLASQLSRPIWAPKVQSIEQFIQSISPLQPAPPLTLIAQLYEVFQAALPRHSEAIQQESLAQFYHQGATLLQDFDMVDRYLVEAPHLFRDLSHQKALNATYDYLTDAQKAAILSFWQSFEKRLSTHQQAFLALWKVLPQVYAQLSTQLRAQGLGYTGLCQRAAYEALQLGTTAVAAAHLVFVGFNVLSPVEEKILAWCHAHMPVDFYWDVDAYYMENDLQEAGDYLRVYQQRPYFQQSFTRPFPSRIQEADRRICLTAVASEVGQVHNLVTQLQALINDQGADFAPHKTAIIVAQEALLTPLLHALPTREDIPIHVAMGYPLHDTTSYQLLEQLLALQVAAAQEDWPTGYLATQYVLPLLRHLSLLSHDNNALAQKRHQQMLQDGAGYVAQRALHDLGTLAQTWFTLLQPTDNPAQYLSDSLRALQEATHASHDRIRTIEHKGTTQLLEVLAQLTTLLQHSPAPPTSMDAFGQLLRQYTRPLRLPLAQAQGPAIQVLSILEARNLDFDNVFILSMNEGHFPAQTTPSSFIPYNLRCGHGLPTADKHQASLFAYHFYRLLQRAQQVFITYSTQTVAGSPSEMSRYLWQLLYESGLPVTTHVAPQTLQVHTPSPIVVPKTDSILQQLDQWTVQPGGTTQGLTPSALNTYLDCRLRFYFRYIAQLKPPPSPTQTIDPQRFGTLLHTVMETLYMPLLQKSQKQKLQPEDFVTLQQQVAPVVAQVFAQTLYHGHERLYQSHGQHIIVQEVIQRLVAKIVALDQAHAPFVILGLEVGRTQPLAATMSLSRGQQVQLRGVIDRIDEKEGVVRVLDYKTGSDNKRISSLAALFDTNNRTRNGAALQTLWYAWLYQRTHPTAQTVMPGLINSRQVFEPSFAPYFAIKKEEGKTYVPLLTMRSYQKAFEAELQQVLEELWDPEVPFDQTPEASRCTHCPYKSICERH